jgi:hypothetical protein
MSEENIGLFPVDLKISSGLAGAPTLYLNLLVDAPTGAISGTGRITQALAPQWSDLPIPSVSGQMEIGGMPTATRLLRVTGDYGIPFGPAQPGQVDAQIMMACSLDFETWNGFGSFDYGPRHEHTARNCKVTNVTPKVEAKVGTLDAVPA